MKLLDCAIKRTFRPNFKKGTGARPTSILPTKSQYAKECRYFCKFMVTENNI